MVQLQGLGQYEGEWLRGTQAIQGRGSMLWQDGSLYEGHWAQNKFNGLGREIHANGDVYIGTWKDSKKHG